MIAHTGAQPKHNSWGHCRQLLFRIRTELLDDNASQLLPHCLRRVSVEVLRNSEMTYWLAFLRRIERSIDSRFVGDVNRLHTHIT